MKKALSLMLSVVISLMVCGYGGAGENLESWNEEVAYGTATFTGNGETLTFSIDDDPATNTAWAMYSQNFSGAYGALATFKVDSYSGEDVTIGLRRYMGVMNSGNLILAELYLSVYKDQFTVNYKVRERDSNGTDINVLARGNLGDNKGTWNLGDKVTLGIAGVGQEIYFYTPTVSALSKVQPLENMGPITDDKSDIGIFGWVWNGDGDISGEVSDFTLFQ